MNKVDITKKVVTLIVGIGTTSVVSTIVKNNVRPEKVIEKITITCATFVLSSMVSDMTKLYTDTKIDEIVNWWETADFKNTNS